MSALGTIAASAALSLGVVTAIKAVRRMRAKGKAPLDRGAAQDRDVIDLKADEGTGVWHDPKTERPLR